MTKHNNYIKNNNKTKLIDEIHIKLNIKEIF